MLTKPMHWILAAAFLSLAIGCGGGGDDKGGEPARPTEPAKAPSEAAAEPEQQPADTKAGPKLDADLQILVNELQSEQTDLRIKALREVAENASVGDMPRITRDELAQLRTSIGTMGKEFRYGQVCLRCGYCQPCQQDVPIPTIFRALDMYRSYPENLKYLGAELYASLEVKADDCVECKECIKKCPAGINIPEMLKEALEVFA